MDYIQDENEIPHILVTLQEDICDDCPFDGLDCFTFAKDPEMHCVQAVAEEEFIDIF